MKCPQCGSDLDTRRAVSIVRLGRIRATACAFCSSFVALSGPEGQPYVLPPCLSCGSAMPPDSESLRCEACDAAGAPGKISPMESEAAEKVQREVFRTYERAPRSDAMAYFDGVLHGLAAVSGAERSGYTLAPVLNLGFQIASMPGPTIMAGCELLSSLEDEAMLAFVLARELAHHRSGRVVRRYVAKREPWALTTGLHRGLGFLTRGTVSLLKGEAEIVKEVAFLGYGAEHEAQADEAAIQLLLRAGYDPEAAVRHLMGLEERHLSSRGALAAFLDSHPARSRRRCLAETLIAIHRGRQTPRRTNREAYRRAAASLMREGFGAQAPRAPRPETLIER